MKKNTTDKIFIIIYSMMFGIGIGFFWQGEGENKIIIGLLSSILYFIWCGILELTK